MIFDFDPLDGNINTTMFYEISEPYALLIKWKFYYNMGDACK